MSEGAKESAELGAAAFAAFNAQDLDRLWALLDDECVVETDPAWPGGGAFRGQKEFEEFLVQFVEAFGHVVFDQEEWTEMVGELALMRGRWVGSGRTSGIETRGPRFTAVVSARNGLITGMRLRVSRKEAEALARDLTRGA